MPIISPERVQDRYDTILGAAEKVFSDKGYQNAAIADIARLAGVSDGLVYRYFQNKRALLYHVLAAFYQRIMVGLEREVFRETVFERQLCVLILRHLEVFVADTKLCWLFISEVRTAQNYDGSAIQDLNRAYTSVVMKITGQAIASGQGRSDIDPRLLRDVIFGTIEHRAWGYVNGRGTLDVRKTARELTKLIANGFCRTAQS